MFSVYSTGYQLVIKTLRDARIEKSITQAKLAEALGRPLSFIDKVENGERKLDVVEFAVIARLLGVDAGAIIERIGGRFHSL
ncbi:helix-turn-helix domain-containing protein [Serratia liquefaciens]|jgi:transcriptional regulator with XRE-family HTH domain|uniref:helix-turn-helix domain-containing protein n=1 Tax=Serratia liquefaciens TaxID=614 RepID=UPI000E05FA38|nr:helix-turn-helix transcriptional regulator [Serratia liquefaciens]MBF8103590.1 helix-turn-helix transcriptional regulator [Serratia liquefaciens]MDU4174349.1 helix-turn-helix transcriptional regulator [Serratia liquefaciens]RYM83566.1 transcriptional regulator [Serratia liquefaciens]CAB1210902.1 Helix-turn-helix domain protein [Serratia liquefaciens]CAI0699466.1 Predicted transcriptional regulator [Serratia liquefaciens]